MMSFNYNITFFVNVWMTSIHERCFLLSDVKLNKKLGFNHGVMNRFCMIAVSLKLKKIINISIGTWYPTW